MKLKKPIAPLKKGESRLGYNNPRKKKSTSKRKTNGKGKSKG